MAKPEKFCSVNNSSVLLHEKEKLAESAGETIIVAVFSTKRYSGEIPAHVEACKALLQLRYRPVVILSPQSFTKVCSFIRLHYV